MTLDLTKTDMNGQEVQDLLDSIFITTNKEAIPNEKLSPFKTSGLRIGTPAITTRGFNEDDCQTVAEIILAALKNHNSPEKLAELKAQVFGLTAKHPIEVN